jgi:hypothetical protein
MRYRALRGVCIGVGRDFKPGDDPVELDAATAQFLTSIGAVEKVKDEPEKVEVPKESMPEKSGKSKEK